MERKGSKRRIEQRDHYNRLERNIGMACEKNCNQNSTDMLTRNESKETATEITAIDIKFTEIPNSMIFSAQIHGTIKIGTVRRQN